MSGKNDRDALAKEMMAAFYQEFEPDIGISEWPDWQNVADIALAHIAAARAEALAEGFKRAVESVGGIIAAEPVSPDVENFTLDESWRFCLGSSELFSVSTMGRVRNNKTGTILKPSLTHKGYLKMVLRYASGKVYPFVHALVLEAFVSPRPEGMQASHLNGDKLDNRPENLVWESSKENIARKRLHGTHQAGEKHGRHKLLSHEIDEIREQYQNWPVVGNNNRFGFGPWVRERFGIEVSYARKIARNKHWVPDIRALAQSAAPDADGGGS